MKFGKDKKINKIKVTFNRKNKKYIKDVYLIFTNSRKVNLLDPNPQSPFITIKIKNK